VRTEGEHQVSKSPNENTPLENPVQRTGLAKQPTTHPLDRVETREDEQKNPNCSIKTPQSRLRMSVKDATW
jgi:hypothetical protein